MNKRFFKNYIQIIGENIVNNLITTYKCENKLGKVADVSIEDVKQAIKDGIIQNAIIKGNKIVWGTKAEIRFKLYKNYLNHYKILNKAPPMEFVVEGEDIILLHVRKDGDTITIPSFCTGFARPEKHRTAAFVGLSYTHIIIDNMPNSQIQLDYAFTAMKSKRLTVQIMHAQAVKSLVDTFAESRQLENLSIISDTPLQPLNMDGTFNYCKTLKNITANIDTSKVEQAEYMMSGNLFIQSLLDQIKPDFGSLKQAEGMFYMTVFRKRIALKDLNIKNVLKAEGMFEQTNFINGVNLNGLDLQSQENCITLFQNSRGIENVEIQKTGLNIGKAELNGMFSGQDIKSIVIKAGMLDNAISLYGMLGDCKNLEQVIIEKQNMSGKAMHTTASMFEGSDNITTKIVHIQ